MESPERSSSIAVTSGWGGVFSRAMKTAVVAFVVLQLKELFDAGALDTKATAFDALLIGVGILVVEAVLKWTKSR